MKFPKVLKKWILLCSLFLAVCTVGTTNVVFAGMYGYATNATGKYWCFLFR